MPDETTPANETPKPATPDSAASSAPDAELKALRDAASSDQAEMAKLKTQMDERKTKIDELEKIVAATSQVTGAYAAAMQSVHAERLEIQEFLATELPRLESEDIVKDNKNEIDARIKAIDVAIDNADAARLSLEQTLDEARKGLDRANEELKARTDALDESKGRQKVIQDRFTQARRIRDQIRQNAGKPIVQYVLALELKRVWDEIKPLLVAREDVEKEYYSRAGEVRKAAAAVAAQEGRFKAAQTARDEGGKGVDALRSKRIEELVKRTGEIPAGAPSATGPATQPNA